MSIVKYRIATAVDKDEDSHVTEVSVEFDGFTIEHAKTMFFKSTSPRVAVQSALRRQKGGIPAKWACKAIDFATSSGSGERVYTPEEMVNHAVENPTYLAEMLAEFAKRGIKV